jgi:hypothetical protein
MRKVPTVSPTPSMARAATPPGENHQASKREKRLNTSLRESPVGVALQYTLPPRIKSVPSQK